MRPKLTAVLIIMILVVAACAGGESGSSDLEIERVTGWAVIVEDRPDGMSIGFSEDRDAEAGIAFDVTEAVWRTEEGPWTEPPVTCLGRGQRVELGITQVENEARPGLLKDRVVWVACLPPDEE